VTDDLLARCTFPPAGSHYTCAVSGGADSSALLVLACAAGLHVTAIHVDHGLRPSSADEAERVRRLANRYGASFRAERAVVATGPNLEARARAARRAVLPADAATGHTADDQAETVLLNLLRGASSGLSAMRPGPRHPLLTLRRRETVSLCRRENIDVVVDQTNDDLAFTRNRIRHQLLPYLAELADRDPVPVLVRQADLLRDDVELLDALAADIDPTDAKALAAAPTALARRAVRSWLSGEHPPDLASVERVLAVARGEALACEVAGGRRVSRSGQRLRLH
jgi:tRNA(Ile)-lysidine synthase